MRGNQLCNRGADRSESDAALLSPKHTTPRGARAWDMGRQLSRSPWGSTRQLAELWRYGKHAPRMTRRRDTQLPTNWRNSVTTHCNSCISRYQFDVERSDGQLLLFPTQEAWDHYQPKLADFKTRDISPSGNDACRMPDNRTSTARWLHQWLAGLSLPGDRVVNCRQFALALKATSQKLGVDYRFNTRAEGLDKGPRLTLQLSSTGGIDTETFDHVVFCTAQSDTGVVTRFTSGLPSLAIHGYTLSVSLKEPLNGPRSAIQVRESGLVLHRMGQRIRVCAGAEVGPRPANPDPKSLTAFTKLWKRIFPGQPITSRASKCGKEPATAYPMAYPPSEPVRLQVFRSIWDMAPMAGLGPAAVQES